MFSVAGRGRSAAGDGLILALRRVAPRAKSKGVYLTARQSPTRSMTSRSPRVRPSAHPFGMSTLAASTRSASSLAESARQSRAPRPQFGQHLAARGRGFGAFERAVADPSPLGRGALDDRVTELRRSSARGDVKQLAITHGRPTTRHARFVRPASARTQGGRPGRATKLRGRSSPRLCAPMPARSSRPQATGQRSPASAGKRGVKDLDRAEAHGLRLQACHT
jgi:hypothetical protein